MRHWDWSGMVEANRVRLLGLLVGVLVLVPTGSVRRAVWREVHGALRPMEAAVRRLIVVLAIDLVASLRPALPFPTGISSTGERSEREPVFRLTDPPRNPVTPLRKSAPGHGPRIGFLDEWEPMPKKALPTEDDLLDGAMLRRRIGALKAALDDLPKQARRLARWMARGERTRKNGTWHRVSTIRSGRAPGHREGGKRAVDEVLVNCHALALWAQYMVGEERR